MDIDEKNDDVPREKNKGAPVEKNEGLPPSAKVVIDLIFPGGQMIEGVSKFIWGAGQQMGPGGMWERIKVLIFAAVVITLAVLAYKLGWV